MHGVREEVGIDEDRVRRAQGGVGLEEQRGADLGDFALGEFGGLFLFRFEFAVGLVLLSAERVSGARGGGRRMRRTVFRPFGLGHVSVLHVMAGLDFLTNDSLHLRKLARLLLDTHGCGVVEVLVVVVVVRERVGGDTSSW